MHAQGSGTHAFTVLAVDAAWCLSYFVCLLNSKILHLIAGIQQSLAQEEDGGVSQGADFMQQNTRVVVLTLEASLQPLIITQSFEAFVFLLACDACHAR